MSDRVSLPLPAFNAHLRKQMHIASMKEQENHVSTASEKKETGLTAMRRSWHEKCGSLRSHGPEEEGSWMDERACENVVGR